MRNKSWLNAVVDCIELEGCKVRECVGLRRLGRSDADARAAMPSCCACRDYMNSCFLRGRKIDRDMAGLSLLKKL